MIATPTNHAAGTGGGYRDDNLKWGGNVTIKARTRETTRKNYTQDISNRDTTDERTRASPRGKLDEVSRDPDPAKRVRSREPMGLGGSHQLAPTGTREVEGDSLEFRDQEGWDDWYIV